MLGNLYDIGQDLSFWGLKREMDRKIEARWRKNQKKWNTVKLWGKRGLKELQDHTSYPRDKYFHTPQWENKFLRQLILSL